MELIRQVLEARSVPAGHPRMPILVRRRTQPSCTHHVGRVHIFSEPWNAPETLPPKDTEDGVRLRAELNRGSLAALQARYGVFDLEVWTDAVVAHAEQPDCVSACRLPLCPVIPTPAGYLRGQCWPPRMLVLCGSLCLCREPGEIRPDHSTEISGSPGSGFTELALSPRGGTPEDHGRLH